MIGTKCGVCVLAIALFWSSDGSARQWTDRTGRFSVEAEFLGMTDGKVSLKRKDGVVVKVPLGTLSLADQKYVAAQVSSGGLGLVGKDANQAPPKSSNVPGEKSSTQSAQEAPWHKMRRRGSTPLQPQGTRGSANTKAASSQWIRVSKGRILEVVTTWDTLREFRKLGCELPQSLRQLQQDLGAGLGRSGKEVMMSDGEELDFFLQPVMSPEASNRLTLDNSKDVSLALLDHSPRIFEIDPKIAFIGINKAVTQIKEPKYREAFLMVGIYYALRILSGEKREDVLMAECKQIGVALFGSEQEYSSMWRAAKPIMEGDVDKDAGVPTER